MPRTYKLEKTERDILNCITRSPNATPKEIAREVGTDENTAKRLYNRLFAENACSQLVLPNYALLGYKVMIVQKLSIKSRSLPDAPFIIAKIESEWKNCIDCHETFDGKVFVRSVWKNAEEFKDARTRFHQKHGMDWLGGEDVDMVPLNEQKGVIAVRGIWDDDADDKRKGSP
ncbi:winged helix-turn-helix transcriptional regulator [Candidatus Woesearchaeota archaeon]|nr:winged helix-turn-helix transcriptional regulator [Candidatus Woesearchaeota archaeon]